VSHCKQVEHAEQEANKSNNGRRDEHRVVQPQPSEVERHLGPVVLLDQVQRLFFVPHGETSPVL
jgi:hypothetical protein